MVRAPSKFVLDEGGIVMKAALIKAIAWKLAYIRDARPSLLDDIAKYTAEEKAAINDRDRAVARGLKEDYEAKLRQLDDERRVLTDPRVGDDEKTRVVKTNLEKRITAARGVLRILTDGDARLEYEREIAEWELLLKGL
jgi:hypothetical protein